MGRRLCLTVGLILLLINAGALAQNLLNQPESVEYDITRNRYFAANAGNGRIIAIDSAGAHSVFNEQLLLSLGLHIKGDTLYVASSNGLYPGLVGFDLTTDSMVIYVPITGNPLMNDVTSDTSGYFYATDYNNNLIYKIDVLTETYSTFVSTGLNQPNGIKYDPETNRVLFLNEQASGGPVCAINLEDSTFTEVVSTGLSITDGLARDKHGNWYVSDWTTSSVYRYNSDFSSARVNVSSGHNGPADIFFDTTNSLLVVPNYTGNRVDLVEIWFGPELMETGINDATGGDGDMILESGESIELVLNVYNQDAFDYDDVSVELSTGSPDISLNNAAVVLGSIESWANTDNSADPFTFDIDAGADPQMVTFTAVVDFNCAFGPRQVIATFDAAVGEASILVINDCVSGDDSHEYYRSSTLR